MKRPEEFIDREAYAAGQTEAAAAVAKGRLGWREYGKVVPWWEDAAAILKSEYGIEFTVVGACITMADVASNADGYNDRMLKEIERRHGNNVVEATFRRVERKLKKLR